MATSTFCIISNEKESINVPTKFLREIRTWANTGIAKQNLKTNGMAYANPKVISRIKEYFNL